MIGVSEEIIQSFTDYLFKTEPFNTLINGNNKEGIKNIVKNLLEDLYQNIPEDTLNYLEKNASNRFLDLLYREAGISDYHISRVPENLKVRLSYLLNILTINRSTQKIFSLFHEALEDFFPKMNIYLININPSDLGKDSTLKYSLEPRYISDPDNIITEVNANDLSGTFLMRPDQFIDREEKFSNIYTDYKSKQRIINIFPIKTGIIYVQNPSGIGQSHFDDYIPLMQMIGATLQKNSLIPWKMKQDEQRKLVPFLDFIKICTYLKFKEFEFKQPKAFAANPSKIIKVPNPVTGVDEVFNLATAETYTWYTEPFEIYRSEDSLMQWEQANFLANKDGFKWSKYYTPIEQKLNDMILDDEDLLEANRLELVYKGLKRSGLYNSRQNLNQFKTDWNTLRQKPKNISLRTISNMKEFREELIGVEPSSVLDFELTLLRYFKSDICGEARTNIFIIKDLYQTNKDNTNDPANGLITLINKFYPNIEFNNFIYGTYTSMEAAEPDETQLLLDLFKWYIDNGLVPLLRNYYSIKAIKFADLIDLPYSSPYLNNKTVYDRVYTELTNNDNLYNFIELLDIIKIKYRKVIDQIDALESDPDTTEETYVMIFLNLWKIISAELSSDKRVQFFWNDFFMRFIMGSSFKDFFYDPIMDLFLEYWFPAETSVQNKDISTIRIRDKMQSIPLESKWNFDWTKKVTSAHTCKDQFKLEIFNADGTTKEKIDETFKEIAERSVVVVSG